MARSHALAVGLAALCTLALPASAQAGVDFGREASFQADGIVSSASGADFNGDKKVDLVAPYSFTPSLGSTEPPSKGILVMLGDGAGSGTAHNQALGTALKFVSVGDFNGDGKQDVAGTFDDGNGAAGVDMLIGDGAGNFTDTGQAAAGAHPTEIVRADFNGDGKLDLAVLDSGSNNIVVLLGNGNGTFGAPSNVVLASPPTSLGLWDVNGDNRVDLVATTLAGATVRYGDGAGAFPNGSPVAIPGGANDAAVRDVNGDHRADIAAVTTSTNSVSILLGKAGGGFTANAPVAAGPSPRKIAIADFDLDGKVDLGIFGQDSGGGRFGVYAGDRHGVFAGVGTFAAGRTGGLVADFDGDKALDIATGSGDFSTSGVSRETVKLELNSPDVSGATSLDFGTQVARAPDTPKTVTLTNNGAPSLHITGAKLTGSAAKDFAVVASTCINKTIARKKTCALKVGFKPQGLGTRSATLRLVDDSADRETLIPLKGKGKRNAGVGIRHRTLKLDSRGKIRLRVSCPGPRTCKGEISIRTVKALRLGGSKRAHHVTVARKKFLMLPGARRTIVVRATRSGRSLMRTRSKLRVKVRASKQGAFVQKVSFSTNLRKRR
jgi:hypothetical protein